MSYSFGKACNKMREKIQVYSCLVIIVVCLNTNSCYQDMLLHRQLVSKLVLQEKEAHGMSFVKSLQ